MKRTISLSGALLLAAASLGGAAGFEELRSGAALSAVTLEKVEAVEVRLPERDKVSLHPGDGAIRLSVTVPGGMKASASAIYMASVNSRACTEFSWNEGSGGRPPKRIYPVFPAANGAITIPQGMGTDCDYRRVDEGTLSFSLPGRAEPYNTVTVLRGGGAGEQRIRCEVIEVRHPSGEVKEMVSCHGNVRLDATNQARVVVEVSAAAAALKVSPAPNPEILCEGEKGAFRISGRLSYKGGSLEVFSRRLYSGLGGEGETVRFNPATAGSPPGMLAFESADSNFFWYDLTLPQSAIGGPGKFTANLRISFNDESSETVALRCSSK